MPYSVALWGTWKSGKTHLAMTFPAPVHIFDLEEGAEAVRPHLPADKAIHIHKVAQMGIEIAKLNTTGREVYESFRGALRAALASSQSGTIVYDTGTKLRGLVIRAATGEAGTNRKRLEPYEYREPDDVMRSLLLLPASKGWHLVVTHHAGDEWAGDKRTGKKLLAGFDETSALVDMTIRVEPIAQWKEIQKEGKAEKVFLYNQATIEACRFGMQAHGLSFTNPSYETLATLVKALKGEAT